MGNAADMPKPREFDDSDRWHIGKPDLDRHLAASTSCRPKPPTGGAATTSRPASPKIATSRRSRASRARRPSCIICSTYAVDADVSGDSNGDDSSAEAGEFLNEFAVGKNGDSVPRGHRPSAEGGIEDQVRFPLPLGRPGNHRPVAARHRALSEGLRRRSTSSTRSSWDSRPSRSTSPADRRGSAATATRASTSPERSPRSSRTCTRAASASASS